VNTQLNQTEINEACDLAQETFNKWKAVGGHYINHWRSHLIGKLGELAIEKSLNEKGIRFEPHFRDEDQYRACDISVAFPGSVMRLEVKCWPEENWDDLGRCVARSQVDAIEKKADCVVWSILRTGSRFDSNEMRVRRLLGLEVTAFGWSTIDDVRSAPIRFTGRAERPKVENHQLDDNAIRPFSVLLSHFAS